MRRKDELHHDNPLDFTGKVAIVTGAAAGMGLATANAFAELGAAVVLADFKEEAVKATAQKLVSAGHKRIPREGAVRGGGQGETMVGRPGARVGRINGASNNARA